MLRRLKTFLATGTGFEPTTPVIILTHFQPVLPYFNLDKCRPQPAPLLDSGLECCLERLSEWFKAMGELFAAAHSKVCSC